MLCYVKRMPRPAGMLVWTAGAVALHAVVPFELSRLGDRAGRPARMPPAVRGAGLVTAAAGVGLMAWALAAHCQAAPRGWALESGLTPQYLLRSGPYRLSRNPMYAGEAVVWLGWALFYRRPPVWAGLAIECAAFAGIVRWEEQRLLGRFGGGYRAYLAEVPRWVPRARRAPGRTRCRCIDRPRLIRVARVAEMGCKVFDGGTRVTPFRPRRIGVPASAARAGRRQYDSRW
jgi:protein-S-isoprenylcysteine O-methyltransferase Ste14